MAGIRSIAEIRDEHRGEAGGKAIGLARLVRLGLPVPPAFAVEASFFESIRARWPEEPEPETLAERLPPELLRPLLAALDGLGPAPAGYAVRSSAPLEDAGAASFAGVHETILRVARDAVPAALLRCWASGFSPRALEYRRRRGLPAEPADIRMAAVVQVMCRPEAAGVIFTREPAGVPGWIRIEAVAGGGESMGRGSIRPAVVRIGPDARLERGDPAGGPRLEDPVLRTLAEWSRRAESAWGEPLDLEWAVDGGRVIFLQARPIAAPAPGSPERDRLPDLEKDTLWIRAVLPGILPEFPSPLLQSWLERLDWDGPEPRRGSRPGAPAPAIRVIEGRIYFNPPLFERWKAGPGGDPAPSVRRRGVLADLLRLFGRGARRRAEEGRGDGATGTRLRFPGEPGTRTDLQLLSDLREAEIDLGLRLRRLPQSAARGLSAMRALEWLLPGTADRERLLAQPDRDGEIPGLDRDGRRWLPRPLRRLMVRRAVERLRDSPGIPPLIHDEEGRGREEPDPGRSEIGRRLIERGILERPEDLFLLRMEEIERVLEGEEPGRDFRSMVARRRAEFRRRAETRVPDRVRESEIGDLRNRAAAPRRETGVIQGMPVGPGRAEGRVVVLEAPHQIDRVRRGDILVVPSLDPSWIPLLALAGGLIVERGGSLTHGSILAREYALPVVANIAGITGILKTGERILLDGGAGSIRRVESSGGGAGEREPSGPGPEPGNSSDS